MALNHTVFLETKADGTTQDYSASSPDEQAFVSAAAFFGTSFLKRDLEEGKATVQIKKNNDEVEELEVKGNTV